MERGLPRRSHSSAAFSAAWFRSAASIMTAVQVPVSTAHPAAATSCSLLPLHSHSHTHIDTPEKRGVCKIQDCNLRSHPHHISDKPGECKIQVCNLRSHPHQTSDKPGSVQDLKDYDSLVQQCFVAHKCSTAQSQRDRMEGSLQVGFAAAAQLGHGSKTEL